MSKPNECIQRLQIHLRKKNKMKYEMPFAKLDIPMTIIPSFIFRCCCCFSEFVINRFFIFHNSYGNRKLHFASVIFLYGLKVEYVGNGRH